MIRLFITVFSGLRAGQSQQATVCSQQSFTITEHIVFGQPSSAAELAWTFAAPRIKYSLSYRFSFITAINRFVLSRFSGWLRHNSNRHDDAVTGDSPANNNAAIFGKHVRELETRHETSIEKLLNATEEMILAGRFRRYRQDARHLRIEPEPLDYLDI